MKFYRSVLCLSSCLALILAACGASTTTPPSNNTAPDTGGGGGGFDIGGDGGGTSDGTGGNDGVGFGDSKDPGSDVAAGDDSGKSDAANSCCADHGAQCGFIKECPKSCGACSTGQKCDTTHKCVATVTKPLKKFGEPCGQTKDCQRPANNSDQAALTAYFECLNAQCEDGVCNGGVCSKPCNIGTDDKNNATGAAGADGIEDVGATSDCGGAVDGPVGTKFACVQLLSPQNGNAPNYIFCLPESDYKLCKADSECSAGDSCQLQLIYGAYRQMCAPAMKTPVGTDGAYTYKPGNKLAQPCNDNPVDGDLAMCANDFCSGAGFCLGFCNTDDDCVTQAGACSGGKCPSGKSCSKDAECSGYSCKPNIKVSSNPAYSTSLCLPKDCQIDGDCGAGFFCRPYWNGVKKVSGEPDPADPKKTIYPAFQPGCQPIAEKTVKPGEACDPYVNSKDATKKGAACQNPYACVDGSCGSLCKADKDCTVDQQCGVDEIPLDVDNPKGDGVTDGIYDFELSLDICAYLPKAAGKCAASKDCSGTASYCKAFVHTLKLPADATPIAAKDTVNGVCVAPDPKGGKGGDTCGPAANDVYCNSGYCLNTQNQTGGVQPGFCVDWCSARADCPATTTIGTTDYKNICRTLRLGFNNTLDDPRDDLWLPVCYPIAATNSLDACSPTLACKASGEQCLPMTIASGPDSAAKVEYICATVGTTATKAVGEACDPNPAQGADPECKAGLGCNPDAAGKGYCTALCSKDADCGSNDGMMCDLTNQWLPRADASKAAIVPTCKKAKSCVPCAIDNDCAGKYACSNLASSGPADGRCAPTCSTDGDCAGKDGGSKCVAAKDAAGKPTGKSVCQPTACK